MSDFPATAAVVEYALRYEVEREDQRVLERAKLLLLDYLGVALAGAWSGMGSVARLTPLVRRSDGMAPSSAQARRAAQLTPL